MGANILIDLLEQLRNVTYLVWFDDDTHLDPLDDILGGPLGHVLRLVPDDELHGGVCGRY